MARVRSAEEEANLPRGVMTSEMDDPDKLFIVDRILEPQTVAHFLEFSWHGILYNGKKTSLPLLDADEIQLVTSPYKEWAPSPHDAIPDSCIHYMMVRIGSHEDSSRLTIVEKDIHAMKSRLWECIVPLSENRWLQKELDRPESFSLACQHISNTIEAFIYLNQTEIREKLRDTFNLISDHLKDFEIALNQVRTAKGKGEPSISMTGLWEEFIRALYEAMTTHAHRWALTHIEKLRADIIRELLTQRPLSQTEYSPEQWTLTNKLHDLSELASQADYAMYIPMVGYSGHSPRSNRPEPDIDKRRQKYGEDLKALTRINIVNGITPNSESYDLTDSRGIVETYGFQVQGQETLRKAIHGDAVPLPRQPWIRDLKSKLDSLAEEQKPQHWGFVAYRITYDQTDEEWAAFLTKLEADFGNWGSGLAGVEDVKDGAKLQWQNGKELGIPEGDIEAAKKHFATINSDLASTYHSDVFLVVDSQCVTSYNADPIPPYVLLPGDSGGFVIVVDPDFDPDEINEHAEESPGFSGHMRILGSLVWGDLYPLMASQTQYPMDLWPLAMNHPMQVYVGPTVALQMQIWQRTRSIRDVVIGKVAEWVKEHQDSEGKKAS